VVCAAVLATTASLFAAGLLAARPAGASPGGVAATVTPGLVDVDTNLAYQGSAAAGTGMVIGSSGVVLTNNHVISGATTIHVVDKGNGHTYVATVVGYDVADDVAVLQLQHASGLTTVAIGDSSKVKSGDAVTAIGNAGGVGGTPTVTTGRVVALNQPITATDGADSERLTGLIETDALLQPGDSGGPLVNASAQVIGINTAGASSGGGFQFDSSSDGFAIPINKAMAIANQIQAGHASTTIHIGPTAFLGVSVQMTSPQLDGYGYQTAAAQGAVVLQVVSISPLRHAGVVAGDVITTLDGKRVTSVNSIRSVVLSKAPGSTIKIRWVDQAGQAHTASVRLASGPPQ
jgi:S1-C subfamily serine protease